MLKSTYQMIGKIQKSLLPTRLAPQSLFLVFVLSSFFAQSCKTGQSTGSTSTAENKEHTITFTVPDPTADYVLELNRKVGPYRASYPKKFDLVHTKLDVKFDWGKQYLLGQEWVTVTPHFYDQDTLILDAKGMDIHHVALLKEEDSLALDFSYPAEKLLKIELPQTASKGDTLMIYINYTAKPNELKSGGSRAITSNKGLYFINPTGDNPDKPRQLWTQGETEASSCWFPTIDAPNQKTTEEIIMTVDSQFVTLSNGLLINSQRNDDGTRTDHWKQELPHAPYLFMMAVGDFAIVEDTWRSMPVHYYVDPTYKNDAMAVFGNTPKMIEFFSQLLGVDFPWEKYHSVVVEDFVSGAMENTTASVFNEGLHITSQETIDKTWDGIIAHELFHQWFGDLVTTESWSNIPLNESFANYSEYLWFEHLEGKDYADYLAKDELEQYLAESERKQVDLIRYYYKDKEDMFDAHSYAKGGRILHMLRSAVGDEAFFASLNHYLVKNKFTEVEIGELRMAFEEITGQDMHWFFDQWFLAAGHPMLNVETDYDEKKGLLSITVKQLQDSLSTPIYTLPVTIGLVDSQGNKESVGILITKATQTFTFPLAQEPAFVHFDQEEMLLAEVDYELTEKEAYYQWKYGETYLARYRSLEFFAEHLESDYTMDVFNASLEDPFWAIRKQGIEIITTLDSAIQTEFMKPILELAINDPKSDVRAEAVSFFANPDFAVYSPQLFDKALKDSSFMVQSRALVGLLYTQGRAAIETIETYENIKNEEIIRIVTEFYGALGRVDKLEYFDNIIENSDPQTQYFAISNLGIMLQVLPAGEDRQRVIDMLVAICKDNDAGRYSKFAAFRALSALRAEKEIQKLMEQIYEQEDKEFVKSLYDNVM